MARLTVEDCLKHIDNRFNLVLEASRRARQIANGAEPAVAWDNDKSTVVALREIAEGQLDMADKFEAEMEALAQQEQVAKAHAEVQERMQQANTQPPVDDEL